MLENTNYFKLVSIYFYNFFSFYFLKIDYAQEKHLIALVAIKQVEIALFVLFIFFTYC